MASIALMEDLAVDARSAKRIAATHALAQALTGGALGIG